MCAKTRHDIQAISCYLICFQQFLTTLHVGDQINTVPILNHVGMLFYMNWVFSCILFFKSQHFYLQSSTFCKHFSASNEWNHQELMWYIYKRNPHAVLISEYKSVTYWQKHPPLGSWCEFWWFIYCYSGKLITHSPYMGMYAN